MSAHLDSPFTIIAIALIAQVIAAYVDQKMFNAIARGIPLRRVFQELAARHAKGK